MQRRLGAKRAPAGRRQIQGEEEAAAEDKYRRGGRQVMGEQPGAPDSATSRKEADQDEKALDGASAERGSLAILRWASRYIQLSLSGIFFFPLNR